MPLTGMTYTKMIWATGNIFLGKNCLLGKQASDKNCHNKSSPNGPFWNALLKKPKAAGTWTPPAW